MKPDELERLPTLDWLVVGAESGPHRRPCEIAWLERVAAQCDAAGVPLYVKQGSALRPGQQANIPDRLWRRKEFPRGLPSAYDHHA